jgi:lysyl-tRNA synthetase class 2
VPSTVIAKIEYDELCQELIVTFVSGKKYVYQPVPHEIYIRFASSRSKGTFFNEHIRDRYNYSPI